MENSHQQQLTSILPQKLFNANRVYLVLGEPGVGKTSFIKTILGTQNYDQIKVGQQTQCCLPYQKDNDFYIDTPGINTSFNKSNKYESFLQIIEYLQTNQISPNKLFIIYIQNKNIQNHIHQISTFSYIFFLYETFGKNISADIEKLNQEFINSAYFLNWSEQGSQYLKDSLTSKRKIIENKIDEVSQYLQQFHTHSIVVKAFTDKKIKEELESIDMHRLQQLKEQEWSNKCDESNLYEYKEYLSKQEHYLFKKINTIIENERINEKTECQTILLLGQSQVGKSSLIDQLNKTVGERGLCLSATKFCSIVTLQFDSKSYKFIDTPSLDETDPNQIPGENLKMIADFLRRNKITKFKILYLRDGERCVRDDRDMIFKKLSLIIKNPISPNTSLDSIGEGDNQRPLLETGQDGFYNQMLACTLDIETVYNDHEISTSDSQEKSLKFKTHYYIKQKNRIDLVKEEDDQKQKKILFEKVNKLDLIDVEKTYYNAEPKKESSNQNRNRNDDGINWNKILIGSFVVASIGYLILR